MTADEIKEKLSQYKKIRRVREQSCNRIENKRKDMNCLQAIVSNGMPRNNSISDTVERAIELMDELIQYYLKIVLDCEICEMQTLKIINSVENMDGRLILNMYYIDGIRFDEIEKSLGISETTRKRRYNEAIEEIEKSWPCLAPVDMLK